MSRYSRFEVVRVPTGWIARFIAANGREIWRTSEVYKRRAGVANAIDLMAWYGDMDLEVREVDER